jgi:hypothetical protein
LKILGLILLAVKAGAIDYGRLKRGVFASASGQSAHNDELRDLCCELIKFAATSRKIMPLVIG